MISSLELAKLCNVSQGTVDRALHNRKGISEKTREIILSKAKEHGYIPNPAARELLTGKSKIVAATFPQSNSIFFMDLFIEIKDQLRLEGYNFVFSPFDDENELLEILGDFSARRYYATIVIPPYDHMKIPNSIAVNMKVVSIIAPLEKKYSFISHDECETGIAAANFFAKNGHNKVLNVTSNRNSYAIQARSKGFLDKSIELDMDISVLSNFNKKTLLDTIKKTEATAIFCHNDWIALEVLRFLESESIKIPNDITLLGVDNSLTFNQFNSDITTIQYPYQWVAKQLLNSLSGKKITKTQPLLKIIKKRTCS